MTFSQTNFENEWWRSMQLLQKKEKHQQYIFNTYTLWNMNNEGSKYERSLNIYRTILHYYNNPASAVALI